MSERWEKYNASAPAGELQRETISLFHPELPQDYHFTTWKGGFTGNVRSSSVTFVEHPFNAKLPEASTSGRNEIQIDLFNSGPAFVSAIKAIKADVTTPIDMEYNVYFEADTDGVDAARRIMSGVRVGFNVQAVSIYGTWLDFLNKKFPRQIFSPTKFRGLVR